MSEKLRSPLAPPPLAPLLSTLRRSQVHPTSPPRSSRPPPRSSSLPRASSHVAGPRGSSARASRPVASRTCALQHKVLARLLGHHFRNGAGREFWNALHDARARDPRAPAAKARSRFKWDDPERAHECGKKSVARRGHQSNAAHKTQRRSAIAALPPERAPPARRGCVLRSHAANRARPRLGALAGRAGRAPLRATPGGARAIGTIAGGRAGGPGPAPAPCRTAARSDSERERRASTWRSTAARWPPRRAARRPRQPREPWPRPCGRRRGERRSSSKSARPSRSRRASIATPRAENGQEAARKGRFRAVDSSGLGRG